MTTSAAPAVVEGGKWLWEEDDEARVAEVERAACAFFEETGKERSDQGAGSTVRRRYAGAAFSDADFSSARLSDRDLPEAQIVLDRD